MIEITSGAYRNLGGVTCKCVVCGRDVARWMHESLEASKVGRVWLYAHTDCIDKRKQKGA